MNFLYVVVHLDGLIGIATRLQAGQPRNQGSILGGMRFFSSSQHPDWSGAHPFSCLMGTGSSVPGSNGAGA
jgi:hypothetical protein